MIVCKIFTFDSAHKLERRSYDAYKNFEVFGKCNTLHGHTYKLEVYISGQINDDGMVVNFNDISKFFKIFIDTYLDHKDLNLLWSYDRPTTAENLLIFISKKVRELLESTQSVDRKFTVPHLDPVTLPHLVKLRLWETPTSFVEGEL